jgi:pimeloyl-ACP methyl ester carboxylesterase/AraC-like DNA-binding protein
MKPSTQYTKSGRINIAYQVFGSGPIDMVYIPGWVSNIDLMWDCPELVHFFEQLAKVARIILFDKRGTGLSDRVVDLSTLEERMDDIRAVMDAVGSQKAVLFGHSEGGSVSALFAATYPNRTISLITFGVFAKRRYSAHYPWAPTDEERQKVYDMIDNSWGSGEMELQSLAPSKAKDKQFMEWLANYFRSGASPSAAMVLTKMNTEVDIIDILGSIKVPTLIMQRSHDIDVKIEEGRFIAARIEGAKFVEFSGSDHLFWSGNTEEILSEIKAFLKTMKPIKNYKKQLLTFIKAEIEVPEKRFADVHGIIGQYIGQFRGRIVRFQNHKFVAIFEGPSKATHCSLALMNAVMLKNARLKVGICIREAAIDEVDLAGDRTELEFDQLLSQAAFNQVIITQTAKNLLSGAGLNFKPYSSETAHSNVSLTVFTVHDEVSVEPSSKEFNVMELPLKGTFLENVLQSIDNHLRDEDFSVEQLSREVGMSERQLQRKLKSTTNKTPNQLITSVRLHRAKELMQNGNFNISEAAHQTGFSSPSYFAKCFKKEFGITPSDFQSSHK